MNYQADVGGNLPWQVVGWRALRRGVALGESVAQALKGGVQAGQGWIGGLDLGEVVEGEADVAGETCGRASSPGMNAPAIEQRRINPAGFRSYCQATAGRRARRSSRQLACWQ
jgi:hypothetical protein